MYDGSKDPMPRLSQIELHHVPKDQQVQFWSFSSHKRSAPLVQPFIKGCIDDRVDALHLMHPP
jgi:hypothetical protein